MRLSLGSWLLPRTLQPFSYLVFSNWDKTYKLCPYPSEWTSGWEKKTNLCKLCKYCYCSIHRGSKYTVSLKSKRSSANAHTGVDLGLRGNWDLRKAGLEVPQVESSAFWSIRRLSHTVGDRKIQNVDQHEHLPSSFLCHSFFL
jgi:hypothetical protein